MTVPCLGDYQIWQSHESRLAVHVVSQRFLSERSSLLYLVSVLLANLLKTMGIVFGKIDVETPKYTVLARAATYEIRRYLPQKAAQTSYRSAQESDAFRRLAAYIGVFQTPRNVQSKTAEPESIAMTAPVVTAPETIAMTAPVITSSAAPESITMTAPVITAAAAPEPIAMTAPVVTSSAAAQDEMVMQFLLPSKYSLGAAAVPTPTDPSVTIVTIPAVVKAVQTFRGSFSREDGRKRAEALIELLKADGFKPQPSAQYGNNMYYFGRFNPPFTLPRFRYGVLLDSTVCI